MGVLENMAQTGTDKTSAQLLTLPKTHPVCWLAFNLSKVPVSLLKTGLTFRSVTGWWQDKTIWVRHGDLRINEYFLCTRWSRVRHAGLKLDTTCWIKSNLILVTAALTSNATSKCINCTKLWEVTVPVESQLLLL